MLKCLIFILFLPGGESGNGTIVKTGVSSTASIANNAKNEYKAIDGNTATYFMSYSRTGARWIRLYLSRPSMVEKVVIINRLV